MRSVVSRHFSRVRFQGSLTPSIMAKVMKTPVESSTTVTFPLYSGLNSSHHEFGGSLMTSALYMSGSEPQVKGTA